MPNADSFIKPIVSLSRRPNSIFLEGLEIKDKGTGRPLILLHGLQSTMDVWSNVESKLRDCRIVMINMPGRGASNRWKESKGSIEQYYSIEHYVDILHSVISQIGDSVALAGWSMGTMVALKYLEKYSADRVDRLFLLSGVPKVVGYCSTFQDADVEMIKQESKNRQLKNNWMNSADPDAVAYTWMSLVSLDFTKMLGELTIPTWILHGTKDRECSIQGARVLCDSIKGAELKEFPDAGHMLVVEHPEEIAFLIQENL